jgi:hypothetical protein
MRAFRAMRDAPGFHNMAKQAEVRQVEAHPDPSSMAKANSAKYEVTGNIIADTLRDQRS